VLRDYRYQLSCGGGHIRAHTLLKSTAFWDIKLEQNTRCHIPENVILIVTAVRITNLAHYVLLILQYCVKSVVCEFYTP
jgi:hypothetical protein